MVSILRTHLSKMYETDFFIEEFNGGNGIADLVFTTEADTTRELVLDYEILSVVFKHFNRRNKKVCIDKFSEETFLSKSQIKHLVNFLVANQLVEKINENEVIIRRKYSPPIQKIISIEAKLSDWKGGFYQALRYKSYSDESYLAISAEFAHRVDKKLLKRHNIGLMIVTPNEVVIGSRVRIQKPDNYVAYTYLGETMAKAFAS